MVRTELGQGQGGHRARLPQLSETLVKTLAPKCSQGSKRLGE